MQRNILIVAVLALFALAGFAPAAHAQAANRSAAKPEEVKKPDVSAEEEAKPEFLKDYERLTALVRSAQDAQKNADEYTVAVKVINKQIEELVAGLRKLIPEGKIWDPAKRKMVPAPAAAAPSAKPEEKKP